VHLEFAADLEHVKHLTRASATPAIKEASAVNQLLHHHNHPHLQIFFHQLHLMSSLVEVLHPQMHLFAQAVETALLKTLAFAKLDGLEQTVKLLKTDV